MIKFPAYFKITQILIGLLAFFYILYIGQGILIPLIFALLLAILLNPISNFLQRLHVGRVLSIVLSIFILILVVASILYFIGSQVVMFGDALPELKRKSIMLSEHLARWVSSTFKIPADRIEEWLNEKKNDGLNGAGTMVGSTLVTLSGVLVTVFLIPVYIFLFLFYKPLLLDFVGRVFSSDKHNTVSEILINTKSLVQNYIVGLMIEMLIVATLNSTVLLIIGVDYAIILGVIGAIFNLIPYIGGLVAISLPILMALITGTPSQALFVLLGYLIVQLLDNNLLVPMIVASKVKVNALVSIVVVLLWGALWGVAGMFLSIPLTAIFKVIFDRVGPLKAYGFLLGDTMPPIGKKIFRINALHRNSPADTDPKARG